MSVETLKEQSKGLRGALPIQLTEPEPSFTEDVWQILKFHGIYQQHDRDIRGRNNRVYSFMVRSKLPGGRLTAQQYLIHDALADEFGQGDLRFTTRQGIQLHGVIKGDLKGTLQALNNALVSTLGACGDVERNVMFCPAPFGDPIRAQMQATAEAIAEHLAPRTTAYHQIWLENEEGKKELQKFPTTNGAVANGKVYTNGASHVNGHANGHVNGTDEVIEPIYGKTYLPRKFKTAIAVPGDNCTDIFTNDVGLVGLSDEGSEEVHGYNVFVGGGLGMTHNNPETFPLLAKPLGYVPADEVVNVVEKIVLVQRDHGDRENRKHARMKYLINDWGIETFRAKVEEYLGYALEDVRPMPEMEVDDHLGWHQQADGNWFYGIYIENGRVADNGDNRLRSGLRAVVQNFGADVVITPQQNVLLSGITSAQKRNVSAMLRRYGITKVQNISNVRRHSMACPALPTCGLALAEAERFLPDVIAEIERMAVELGIDKEVFTVRMTGCPNGCARPYVADIGLVGRTLGKYSIFLGGNPEGTRLNTLYEDIVPATELPGMIRSILLAYINTRQSGERVGDWANRVGVELIHELTEQAVPA
ncbi:MAG: NADPH-dependent assimilatory sulfite reductase hemoprotein subunit [Caldilineaceae bacterium]|nr:NADPH-dependent assimilatory sulfite reductase hemoprotein subunit [Caldilineaceae bacterium]